MLLDFANDGIVVTAIGSITSGGVGIDRLWSTVIDGKAQPRRLTLTSSFLPHLDHDVTMFAVADADIAASLSLHDEKLLRRLTRHDKIALAAISDMRARIGPMDFSRTAVVWGNGSSTIEPLERGYGAMFAQSKLRVSPLTIPTSMVSAPAAAIARELQTCAPSFSVGSACASSAHGVAIGAMLLANRVTDRVVVGGSEALRDLGAVCAWASTGVLSTTTCRPFDIDRDGIVLGEGAASLLLELEDVAIKEGRKPLARLRGASFSTGEAEMMTPSRSAVYAAVAPVQSLVNTRDILFVNAHGTGTVAGDSVEAETINHVYGSLDNPVQVTFSKHITGHTMSASGAIEAALCVKALGESRHDQATCYPSDTVSLIDPRLQGNLKDKPNLAVSHSFGFGGMNCCLAFESC